MTRMGRYSSAEKMDDSRSEHLEPVDFGDVEVQNDQVHVLPFHEIQDQTCVGDTRGLGVAHSAEQALQRPHDHLIVIDHQDLAFQPDPNVGCAIDLEMRGR